jgi:hypothetical protein
VYIGFINKTTSFHSFQIDFLARLTVIYD